MKRQLKTVTLNIRTTSQIKSLAEKLAKLEERSLASTIERLIVTAYRKREAQSS
jgi:hypothetical protein